MKLLYFITALTTLAISLPIYIICLPFILLGGIFTTIAQGIISWNNYINELLQGK